MHNHHKDGDKAAKQREITANKVIGSISVLIVLNFAEKILLRSLTMNFLI